ncbi:hypothetical protein DBR42_01090, partial [Pelomonas sp. HMWF004]
MLEVMSAGTDRGRPELWDLLEQSPVELAERRFKREVQGGVSALRLPELIGLSKALRAKNRLKPAVAWLDRSKEAAPSRHHLEAARLALEWDQPQLAIELFAKADLHQPLTDQARLD